MITANTAGVFWRVRAALDSKEDLDALVAAINDHGDNASPERLKEARSARDEIKSV